MEYILSHEKRYILGTLCFKEFVIIKVYFEWNKFLNMETVCPKCRRAGKQPKTWGVRSYGMLCRIGW